MQTMGDLGAGAVRGAGSIGATILTPLDMAARAVGIENSFIGRDDRREAMTEGLRTLGANPESMAFQGAQLGTEIAGTLGIPGALAVRAQRMGNPALATALRSGGLASPGSASRVKDAALRLGSGAAVGGAAAGLVNPESADMGAMIGGALPALQGIGPGLRQIAGMTSGVGDDALRIAYETGKTGGKAATTFRSNMRGTANMMDVLDDARANLGAMRAAASAAYRQNTQNLRALTTPMDMAPIFQSVDDVAQEYMFKGQAKNPAAAQAVQRARELVDNWAQLDPATYHTPEGIDALKQQIGALRDNIPITDRPARNAVGRVYRAVGDQIRSADPDYAAAMQQYSEAAELMDEITRSLSLGERTSADTAMRKLQSLMRNNANTNYGARMQAAQALETQGGRPLMPALGGQAVNSWTPRTLQATTATGLGGMFALSGQLPQAAATAAVSSPRLMGETFHGAGRLMGAARSALPANAENALLLEALRRGAAVGAPVMSAEQ